jgi:hypothetical protein
MSALHSRPRRSADSREWPSFTRGVTAFEGPHGRSPSRGGPRIGPRRRRGLAAPPRQQAAGPAGVGPDDRVLHHVGQQQRHDQVEAVELGQVACRPTAARARSQGRSPRCAGACPRGQAADRSWSTWQQRPPAGQPAACWRPCRKNSTASSTERTSSQVLAAPKGWFQKLSLLADRSSPVGPTYRYGSGTWASPGEAP